MIRRTVLAAALAAVFVIPVIAQEPKDPPSITTQGQASFKLQPDIAWVTVMSEARASKPGDAQQKAAEAMVSVQAALKGLGLAANAFKTSQYSLQPEMEYIAGSSRVKGYLARHALEVRVDEISKLGAVIDAAGASGAASVSGMRFDVKNRATVELEALTAAAKEALVRARAIAAGFGREIGNIISVQEQRLYSAQPMERSFAMAGAGGRGGAPAPQTPVETGEIEVRAMMTVVVAIK